MSILKTFLLLNTKNLFEWHKFIINESKEAEKVFYQIMTMNHMKNFKYFMELNDKIPNNERDFRNVHKLHVKINFSIEKPLRHLKAH